MNQLQPSVAQSFIRQLSGFQGYPRTDEARARFAEVLCEVSLSVEHALAIIWAFEENFPTLKEIRDAAFNLRPKFEPKVDQREQWEKEYGKPDPAWSARFAEKAAGMTATVDPKERKRLYAEEKRAMLWQAIRDSLYYTEGPGARGPDQFWSAAAQKHARNHPAEVAAFRVQLAESGWDTLMAVDWLKSMPVAPARPAAHSIALGGRPITAEDVNRELRAQGRESGDGE
jgi:hypothetical protein